MVEGREHILIVEDSSATREILERQLRGEGYAVRSVESVASAVKVLDREPIDLVITDYRMPEADGLVLVKHIRHQHREIGIVMVTGFATVSGAVTAMREGVENYLAKPFSEEELREAVRSALEKLRLQRGMIGGKDVPAPQGMIGESAAMQRIYRLIDRAARAQVPVLIHGESGTGKELVARAVHYQGPRAGEPFLAVNCAAIPEALAESELFGHARGAFTGASASRQGIFAAADGGTLFLDEIAELSPAAQAKLLRVVQEGEIQSVGSDQRRRIDVRVIAATNKDLEEMARQGEFREDLLFRLNVLPIELPPLRARGNDVLLLIRHFMDAAVRVSGTEAPEITDQALEALAMYAWPGNVRELQNIIQRIVLLSDGGKIDVADLPEIMRFTAAGRGDAAPLRSLREVELEHIRAVVDAVGGNKTRAAEILGIDRKSLRARLKAGRSF